MFSGPLLPHLGVCWPRAAIYRLCWHHDRGWQQDAPLQQRSMALKSSPDAFDDTEKPSQDAELVVSSSVRWQKRSFQQRSTAHKEAVSKSVRRRAEKPFPAAFDGTEMPSSEVFDGTETPHPAAFDGTETPRVQQSSTAQRCPVQQRLRPQRCHLQKCSTAP